MEEIEKAGSFYLGKLVNPKTGQAEDQPLQYSAKDLTTHAVCVGMTGSGKTGLGISLLEEAGLDKIPAIIIDPKGDLTNLLLTFPDLSPAEFEPWVDEGEAERKGLTPVEYADYISKKWKEGLASSGESAERIRKLRETVDLKIYTPASKMGTPISILNSFAAPPQEQMNDRAEILEKIQSITSSLLGLLGIAADPIKSREHILISTIIYQAWGDGKDLDIALLIQQIQKPPFTKLGALPLETFYPLKDRIELSISLNSLLASPGFQAWMEGDPLDIQQLLYTKEKKPKLSIISIMHLTDAERMFFVTLLLNEILTWTRQQPGTSSLRAILYMDEIFGFFPPTASPPSKLPMLTLLKQARAYGLGIFLVTQNPVDLDYKGLSNCGTWFIGKLQTERDKSRIVEGLKVASNGEIDTKNINSLLAMTGNRIFIMRSIYEKRSIPFQTRWTLSYLRGPLTLNQIALLTGKKTSMRQEQQTLINPQSVKSNLPPGISEFFISGDGNQPIHYTPKIMGITQLHFVDSQKKIDMWQEICLVANVNNQDDFSWDGASNEPTIKDRLESDPVPNSTFDDLPVEFLQEKNYALFAKKLITDVYQNQTLTLYQAQILSLISKTDETEEEFRVRAFLSLQEKSEENIKKIRLKYVDKIAMLTNKVQRAEEKIAQKQQKAGWQIWQTFISFLTTLISAFFGRKLTKGTISQTGTSIRRAGQIGKDSQAVTQAENDYTLYKEQLEDMENQLNGEIATVRNGSTLENLDLGEIHIRPRKSDITVEKVAVVWWPQDMKRLD